MKKLLISLTGLGLTALAAGAASAASPAYCALYAREYANQVVQPGAAPGMQVSVQDQAYYRCLNQDEDPVLPVSSAYFGADVEAIGVADPAAAGESIAEDVPIGEGDVSGDDVAIAPTYEEPAPAVKKKPRRPSGGLVAWSPEWVDKCKMYYPNSFDPEDGTVLPYSATKRQLCPY